jgi:hypothetical protein
MTDGISPAACEIVRTETAKAQKMVTVDTRPSANTLKWIRAHHAPALASDGWMDRSQDSWAVE